jgi:hypothetical protein
LDDRYRHSAFFTLLIEFEQRVIIRFLGREVVNASDIHPRLSAQFGDGAYHALFDREVTETSMRI